MLRDKKLSVSFVRFFVPLPERKTAQTTAAVIVIEAKTRPPVSDWQE
jgi:hypothetical protein